MDCFKLENFTTHSTRESGHLSIHQWINICFIHEDHVRYLILQIEANSAIQSEICWEYLTSTLFICFNISILIISTIIFKCALFDEYIGWELKVDLWKLWSVDAIDNIRIYFEWDFIDLNIGEANISIEWQLINSGGCAECQD